MTIQEAMKTAIDVQNASNLSGVLHAWAKCQPAVHADMRWYYRRHPVNILFMSKIASLMEVNVSSLGSISDLEDKDIFTEAYNIACLESKP